jgi:hypothetical protein
VSGDWECRPGGACPVCNEEEADEEDVHGDLMEAARSAAQATVTALDRLILAEAVVKAARAYLEGDRGRHLAVTYAALKDALDAHEKGQPS